MSPGKRLLIYGIVFLVLLFLLSCISIYMHIDYLSSYFSSSLSAAGGSLLYLLIFGVGIGLMIKALFK